MKIFYRLVFIPVAAAFVVFAVANRHALTLNLWPLPLEIDLPVYIAVLGALAVGMVIGGSAQWISDGKWRRRARADKRKASALERRLTLVEAAREAQDGEPARPAPEPPAPRRARLPRFRLKSRTG
ncbi:MAG: lipopolysaccharide assembly protein LapA domain-containing protein [Defluviicoccus sp.]|nr:lipopolysaccharide assembly protein LapA domain-containing protein [Defluviicoccus sp.]MDE0274392.1 lipopolysaccharide assembly protein LapA domain-containing protein [Defluviicoccus sp.]